MQRTRITQISILLCVCGLVAFLFLNGKNNPVSLFTPKDSESNKSTNISSIDGNKGFDFVLYGNDIKAQLGKTNTAYLNNLEKSIEAGTASTTAYELLAQRYDSLMVPILAGYYWRKAALKNPEVVKYWNNSGLNFFKSTDIANEDVYFQYFAALAIEAYEKVRKMDPANLDAKANLAECYFMTATTMPMEAIGLLRENLQVNPDHKLSLLYLAINDSRIGKYDKAIERFERLTVLEPSNLFYYPYLIRAYKDAKQINNAQKTFERYKTLEKNPERISEVSKIFSNS